jgi:anti-anti-sigma factor
MVERVPGSTSTAHECAVPVSDEQLWEMSAAFVADGLQRRERVVYFDDGTVEAVLARLAEDRVDSRAAIGYGQLTVVPAEATRAILRSPVAAVQDLVSNAIDISLEQGYSGVRLTGELSYGLERAGGVDLAEYDAGLDEVLRDRPARSLCFYDRRRYPDTAIEDLRSQHRSERTAPAVYDDGLLRITRTGPSTARLAGEVDHSNRPVIARLLGSTLDEALRSHSAPTDITLNLSSLRFLDVAGAVGLVHAAEAFPSTHRLVLADVSPRVLRVLDRCGAPFAAQLVVEPYAADPADQPAVR